MNLMVPVLSAYIAESIGKRPALVPGFVAGMIAIQGLPVNAETGMIDAGGAGVGFGFLGGIVGGFLAGYVIVLLEKVFAKLPKNLDGLKAIFLYRCSRPPSSVWSCLASPAPWLPSTPP